MTPTVLFILILICFMFWHVFFFWLGFKNIVHARRVIPDRLNPCHLIRFLQIFLGVGHIWWKFLIHVTRFSLRRVIISLIVCFQPLQLSSQSYAAGVAPSQLACNERKKKHKRKPDCFFHNSITQASLATIHTWRQRRLLFAYSFAYLKRVCTPFLLSSKASEQLLISCRSSWHIVTFSEIQSHSR